MKQYIDKANVVTKIESLKRPTFTNFDEGVNAAVQTLLEILDTLEVKEVENFIWNNARTTVPEDSTNQIICIKEDGLAVLTIGKIVNGTVKWAYLDDLLNTNSFVKEVDLEKENLIGTFERKVKIDAGGYPYIDCNIEFYDYNKDIPLAKEDDKVKVIVVKREQYGTNR